MEQLADLHITSDPAAIKTEEAQPVGYVYIDMAGRDPGSYIEDAKAAVERNVRLPAGYHMEWSGSYEGMQRAGRRLVYVIPLTLLVIFVLLYFSTRSLTKVCIVFLAVPFSLMGAFLLLWLLGYNLSVAVWVGIIALAGVDAETGVVMLLYLDHAYDRRKKEGRMNGIKDLEEGVMEGAVQRVRPKMMTVMAILMGLLPIMWSTGTGSDMMKRIAAPMVGGVVTSFLMELLIYPAIYTIWKWWAEVRRGAPARPSARRREDGGRAVEGRRTATTRWGFLRGGTRFAWEEFSRRRRTKGPRSNAARGHPDSFVSEEVARWKGLRFDASLADMPCRRLSRPGRSTRTRRRHRRFGGPPAENGDHERCLADHGTLFRPAGIVRLLQGGPALHS